MSAKNRRRQRELWKMEAHREHLELPGRGQKQNLRTGTLKGEELQGQSASKPLVESVGLFRFIIIEKRVREKEKGKDWG